MSRALFATICLLTLPGAASAWAQEASEASTTVEQAIARTIEGALPRAAYAWSLDWSAFGARGDRHVFWSLHPPRSHEPRALPVGAHRRTGWFSVNGRTGDVSLCGDEERVEQMLITVGHIWLRQPDVVTELAGRGVRATLTNEITRQPSGRSIDGEGHEVTPHYQSVTQRYPAERTWRLEKEGRDPVDLSEIYRCTPPGTRSATRCWMTWEIRFRPTPPGEPGVCPAADRS